MTVAEQFHDTLELFERSGGFDLSLLPECLSRACVDVLGVDGAALGVFDEQFRVPLGGSDEQANHAERLQFTLGAGPCLSAVTDDHTVRAGSLDLQERWPMLYSELVEHTAFRSAISVPLHITPTTSGALDLYFSREARPSTAYLEDCAVVAALVVDRLQGALNPGPDIPAAEPQWLNSLDSRRRGRVWVAVGMVNFGLKISASDALALLRAYAWSHGGDLDDLASDLMSGELSVAHLAS